MTDTTDATPVAQSDAKPAKRQRAKRTNAPLTANAMAARLSKAHGVTVTAKAVRQWCRDNVAKYGDDRYTPHAYDAATVRQIEAAWKQRTARRTASKAGGR